MMYLDKCILTNRSTSSKTRNFVNVQRFTGSTGSVFIFYTRNSGNEPADQLQLFFFFLFAMGLV